MAFYRKKPVVVEARHLMLVNLQSIKDWINSHGHKAEVWSQPPLRAISGLMISTLEGDMHASLGDMIIKGVNGEFYPCKLEIFEKTYDMKGTTDYLTETEQQEALTIISNLTRQSRRRIDFLSRCVALREEAREFLGRRHLRVQGKPVAALEPEGKIALGEEEGFSYPCTEGPITFKPKPRTKWEIFLEWIRL